MQLWAWETKKEDDEGLVNHSTTSTASSGCIAYTLKICENNAQSLDTATRPLLWLVDTDGAHPMIGE